MTQRLTTNCAKNYCNRTLIVKVIVENVVTCFLLGHSVGPLLFIMNTTTLSTHVSSLSLNRQIYADNTQLLFLFYPRKFD